MKNCWGRNRPYCRGIGGTGQAGAEGGFLSVRRLFLLQTHPYGLALKITAPFCAFLGLRDLVSEPESHCVA